MSKAFKVKFENIKDENEERFCHQTAQIYKDCLYVYARTKGMHWNRSSRNELWSFDLSMRDSLRINIDFFSNRKPHVEIM